MNRVIGTDEVKVLEEFGIVELFLKRQSGAREAGDKDDGRFGRVASSMGPDLSAVLRMHELSERGHDGGMLTGRGDGKRRTMRGVAFSVEGVL